MKTIIFYPVYQICTFWICVGLFTYFTGNFFVSSFLTKTKDPEILRQMQLIYTIVTISKNVILAFAMFGSNMNGKEVENNGRFRLPDDVILDDFKLTNLNKT